MNSRTLNTKYLIPNTCSAKSRDGFTFIEILIVLGIVAILGTIGMTNYLGLRDEKALDSSTQRIVSDLRSTATNAASGVNDNKWGIRFTNAATDFYEIWQGENYLSGEVTKKYRLTLAVTFTDPAEGASKDVIFARGSGLPTWLNGMTGLPATSIISLSNGLREITISMNQNGRIEHSSEDL